MNEEEVSLTFSGCGFLALYYAGVVICLKKYAPHLTFKHISGASAGAFAACAFLCDVPAEDFIGGMCEMIGSARRKMFGPFTPTYNITEALRKQLGKLYPENAHVKVSGRLRVSLTRVSDRKNVMVEHFDSKEELIDCLLASSFVPVFSGMFPPKFRGVRYMDGMFSDNLPTRGEYTITVSPFSGETDISPRYDAMPFFHVTVSNTSFAVSYPNLLSLRSVFWPPKAKALEALSKQGFEDARRYLQVNNLYLTDCTSTQLDLSITAEDSSQENTADGLPDSVLAVYKHYIDREK